MEIESLYQLYLKYPTVCTDTRSITPGCIFFALSGSNFDGNTFADQALQAGAAYAVVSDKNLQHEKFIHAENTLLVLQQLAHHHRKHFLIPFIAITGSNGKTTTKELINSVLSKKYKVHATKGNFNNHIGVPLTILGMASDAEIGLIEMGANHQGEINMLCEIAMPTHGIITNIGNAHLEGFGSIDGVQKTKGELFDYLHDHAGFAFVNIDDKRVASISNTLENKVTYGINPQSHAGVHFNYESNVAGEGFVLAREEAVIRSEMFGSYNAINMVAAFAIGAHFNVPVKAITESLSAFQSGANRSEIVHISGCTIIKDAYNANPSSMELAVKAFSERYPEGWVILGDMKELGDASERSHEDIIHVVSSAGLKKIILVGAAFKNAYNKLNPSFNEVLLADDIDEIKKDWKWESHTGEAFLLKGSRSMRLEKLLEK